MTFNHFDLRLSASMLASACGKLVLRLLRVPPRLSLMPVTTSTNGHSDQMSLWPSGNDDCGPVCSGENVLEFKRRISDAGQTRGDSEYGRRVASDESATFQRGWLNAYEEIFFYAFKIAEEIRETGRPAYESQRCLAEAISLANSLQRHASKEGIG